MNVPIGPIVVPISSLIFTIVFLGAVIAWRVYRNKNKKKGK
jgi:hypothetical protein